MRFADTVNLRSLALGAALSLALAAPAFAQDEAPASAADSGAFTLGQIVVTAQRPEGIQIGTETLTSEAIYAFNRNSLDEAINVMPGVVASNTGGSRNERLVFVRGFDRFQVPLSIDGIRVYLPADNRLDYGRFLTPDVAEIQVAKGYASVLNGPGALGGAINLVTRKPTKEIEAEFRGALDLDRDVDYAGYTASGLVGTKQDKWYAQASYTRSFRDHWDLAGGFEPTVNENGGERDLTRTRDWRLNVKAGFTPNATDEYAISYTRQEGARNAPLHVTDPATRPAPAGAPAPRYWSWPYWNIDSIYFLSTTALGDQATLKTRIYRNTFKNLLQSFDSGAQTTQSQPYAFDSFYDDKAWGGSAQLDVQLTPADRLSVSAHYRRDKHRERQDGFYRLTNASPLLPYSEPWQTTTEDTYSIAVENQLDLDPTLSLTLGASYDWRDLKKAEEVSGTPSVNIFQYPLANADALNWQGRLDWRPTSEASLHASVSRRSRFPTVFERFSTQFGNAASNPSLKAERATNYEIGGTYDFGMVRAEASVFYSKVDDAIVSVRPTNFPANTSQRRNLGDAEYYGAEIALSAKLGSTLTVGANYSYIHRKFDIAVVDIFVPTFALTDVPKHKGFVYAEWSPVEQLHVVPSLDFASNRTTQNTYVTAGETLYYRTGSYATANLRVDFDVLDNVTIGVGGRNLFDDNYSLTDGFPEAGRSFFASIRAKY